MTLALPEAVLAQAKTKKTPTKAVEKKEKDAPGEKDKDNSDEGGESDSDSDGETPVDAPALPKVPPPLAPADGTAGSATSGTTHPAKTEEAQPEPEPPLTPEEEKARMLERLADIISKRMQSLNERERVLLEREKALRLREESLEQREEVIESRENLSRKKEKLPPPQSWKGPAAPAIGSKYAVVMDARTMQILHAKGGSTLTPVASTQKLMTALIIATENDLDEKVPVPREVLHVEPTCVGIKPGQEYTYRELVTALLVKSGNDVAACLAVANAGSIEKFAEKMNRYARDLGMKNSRFMNPHGLPAKGQHSTAEDMAVVAFEVYQSPALREIVRTKVYDFNFSDGTTRTLYNTNRVLKNYEHCNGMKTGFTYASGKCLISSGHKDEADRIVVVLGSFGGTVWNDSRSLLDWALNLKMESPARPAPRPLPSGDKAKTTLSAVSR